MKKHSGFGPDGTGAIYKIDRTNPASPVVSTFANLNTIFGAGAAGNDPHNQNDFDRDNGDAAWDAVGKVSLGGLAISDDETKLYAMNLASRQLLEIPTNVAPTSANIRARNVPANPPGCSNTNDVRPFAVTYYQNKIYVGMVCSAESTISQSAPDGDASKPRAYVYWLITLRWISARRLFFRSASITRAAAPTARSRGRAIVSRPPGAPGRRFTKTSERKAERSIRNPG